MITLPKYSFGVGDRFGREGSAQLRAFGKLRDEHGIDVTPVWNKSFREHTGAGTKPGSVRIAADAAVKDTGWNAPYFVDADHIRLESVDQFIDTSDFFTLDVADFIGKPVAGASAFADRHAGPGGVPMRIDLPGGLPPLMPSRDDIEAAANKFLGAVGEAGKIYRHIENAKGAGTFVTEVSMDETDAAQTPTELYFILAMIAEEKIPAQTIAPKFTGRFNKGVDYVGDVNGFDREFASDVGVLEVARKAFGLSANLKLSVHSGSDKFSVFPSIRKACARFNAGVHVKTSGTTWVEEIVGLASTGGEALEFAKEIYAEAFARYDELTAPYAAVIDIDMTNLPTPTEAARWSAAEMAGILRHDPSNPNYNRNARQLIHVGFRVAAKSGQRYFDLLQKYSKQVGDSVAENIYNRHLLPIFVG